MIPKFYYGKMNRTLQDEGKKTESYSLPMLEREVFYKLDDTKYHITITPAIIKKKDKKDKKEKGNKFEVLLDHLPPHQGFAEYFRGEMIRYAAENGYDSIAWTTGEQQVNRYEHALRAEALKIVEKIPHRDLAIQWDAAHEFEYLATSSMMFNHMTREEMVDLLVRLGKGSPRDAELGYHCCYGNGDICTSSESYWIVPGTLEW